MIKIGKLWVPLFLLGAVASLTGMTWATLYDHEGAYALRNIGGLVALSCMVPLFWIGMVRKRPDERSKLVVLVVLFALGVALLAGNMVTRSFRNRRFGMSRHDVVVALDDGDYEIRSPRIGRDATRPISALEYDAYKRYTELADWMSTFGVFLMLPLAWTLWRAREQQRHPALRLDQDDPPVSTEPPPDGADDQSTPPTD